MSGTILLVTERDNVRDTFQNAVGKPTTLVVEQYLKDIQRSLATGNVIAVFADEHVGLTSGVDVLKWLHKENPWIPLVLLLDQKASGRSADIAQISQFVHITPPPRTVEDAVNLLDLFLEDATETDAQGAIVVEDFDLSTDSADREIIRSIVQCIDQLPALPLVVQRIQEIITRENASVKDICEVIALDPALAGRVLRLVNSALYGLANPVTTVEHAVALLGFAELKNLTLTLKVMDAFSEWEEGVMDRRLFWEHNLASGICARHLASHIPGTQPDEAFLGALLHDIGKLVLDTYFQDQWRQIQKQSRENECSALQLEEQYVGIPHTIVGEHLSRHWQFPALHQMAVRHHHEIPSVEALDPPERTYCTIVSAANTLVQWMDMGSSGYNLLLPLPREVTDILGLGVETYTDVLQKTLVEIDEWKASLGMTGGSSADERTTSTLDAKNAPELWVISPKKSRIPSVNALLTTLGYRAHVSHWSENILELLAKVSHQALVLDVRGVTVNADKFTRLLKAARERSSAPILVLASNSLELSSREKEGIYCHRSPPHRGVLMRWLRSALPRD
jgi:HD-like signal output (HDOD) protein